MGMRQLVLDLFGAAVPPEAPGAGHHRPPGSAEDRPAERTGAAPQATGSTASDTRPEPPLALPEALAPAHFTHPRANRVVHFSDARVDYELRRGQRRTIGLSVSAEGLTVSAPRWSPLRDVEAVLQQKQRWVIAKLGEARTRHQQLEASRIDWREGAHIPFLGQPLALVLDPRQRHGRGGAALVTTPDAPAGAPRLALHLGLPHSAAPEQLRDTTQAWLMRQARRVFTARLDHFAPELGVRWQKLSLSSAGTRWGSASADGSIRLNWRLIHFREAIIDYVVVHELAHLREMNHSPRFWQTVESVMPDYAERRGALREQRLMPW